MTRPTTLREPLHPPTFAVAALGTLLLAVAGFQSVQDPWRAGPEVVPRSSSRSSVPYTPGAHARHITHIRRTLVEPRS